jgi:hypothetical protein
VLMRGQIMAQVSAPAEPTSLSPVPAAIVSEAKPTPKDTAEDNSTLGGFLKQEGFGVVKLKQNNLDNQKAHKNNSFLGCKNVFTAQFLDWMASLRSVNQPFPFVRNVILRCDTTRVYLAAREST